MFVLVALVLLSALACTRGEQPASSEQEPQASSRDSGRNDFSPRQTRVNVPKGTRIHLELRTSLGSARSQAGDTFTARTTEPVVVGSRVAIPAGSTVHGQVTSVVPAKKGLKEKEGSIRISFDKVTTPSGNSAPMSADLASVAPKSTGKTAGIIGGSAAGGALLGKVLGGDTKDAAVGAVVGGAIGTGIAAGTRGRDVDLPAGSDLVITLDQPLTISVKP
jgi:hypothetical protein